jgi:3-deoxy-D-manno-octulosonic-acid transferase
MLTFWRLFYSVLVLPVLWVVLHILAAFSSKIRRGIHGRTGLFQQLEEQISLLGPGKRVWFHASSLGEFEQAKPIIAQLKQRFPAVHIVTSFFSPSGYEHSRKYHQADAITYLPFDTAQNARQFIRLVRPAVAVMVRYDLWPNHIWTLHSEGIPIMIANATMRRHTSRRLPFARSFHHEVYNCLDNILAVSKSDVEAFRLYDLTHPQIDIVGDTRYDQVTSRSIEARSRHLFPQGVLEQRKVLVAGSSWPEDEEVILPAFLQLRQSVPQALLVLVPHEPTVDRLEEIEQELSGKVSFLRFSALNEYAGEHVIIVDSIGILLILYSYAHVAYVGGSFRQGVHNVLEAAVFGIPVIFGPRHRNSQEPLMLVNSGGGFVVNSPEELNRSLRHLFEDDAVRRDAGEKAARFVQMNVGATERFLQHIQPYLG